MLAIILTVIFPGLGHIYLKKTLRGIILMALSFIWFLFPFVFIFSIIDCYRLNKKIPAENRLSGREATIGVVLFFIVVPILFFALSIALMYGVNQVKRDFVYPLKTERELAIMAEEMDRYKAGYGMYPVSIFELQRGKPIHDSWKSDAWHRAYVFLSDGADFQITSKGADGVLKTSDDISISSKNLE